MLRAVLIHQVRHWQALVPLSQTNACEPQPIQPRALFNLSVGLGSSESRFKRQQQALDDFKADHKEELDALPFETETVPPPHSRKMRAIDTELRRSVVAPDILGVFPRQSLPPVPAKSGLDRRLVFRTIQLACENLLRPS